MKSEWKRYWSETGRYAWYLPLGMLVSIPIYLLNFDTRRWFEPSVVFFVLTRAAVSSVTFALVFFGLFGAVYAVLTWILIQTGRMPKWSWFHTGLIAVVGLVLGISLMPYSEHFVFGTPLRVGSSSASFVFGGFICLLFFLFSVYREAREEMLALRATAAEAKYHALETQMQPHFLFNALNSLAELIESGHERAADVTYSLSDLYRRILENSRVKTASLESEIEIVRRYLELERLRFGKRLTYSIDVPPDAGAVFLPSLMLQTLVENAVKHGVAKAVEGGEINVVVKRAANNLFHVSVTNSGAPFRDGQSAGTGLDNSRKRLELLYGNRSEFHIGSNGDGRTVVEFTFSGDKID